VTVAPGTIEAASAHIRVLIERMRVVNWQLKDAHRQLDSLYGLLAKSIEGELGQANEQRDAAILASLPGNGRIVLATRLAEGWEALQRRQYHALRAPCGAAPVTRRSGKSGIVTRRLACNPRLKNALYHWARVGDRLLNVTRAMLRNGTQFNPHWKAKSWLLTGRKPPDSLRMFRFGSQPPWAR
jgi:transposase